MKEKLTLIKVGGAIVEDEALLDQLLDNFCAICSGKKLSIAIEQFEGVPLAWIM